MVFKKLFHRETRNQARIEKLLRAVTNPYGQSADRYGAMEQLLADGSDDALAALFRRFTVTSTKGIEDEEEKGWLYRSLRDLGPKVLRAAERACLNTENALKHDNIAWALRIIEDVADEDEEWRVLDALLEKHPPGYERDPAKKIQLLTHIAEIDGPKVVLILTRYLDDPDEGVRFVCVEQLLDIGDVEALPALVARLAHPKEDSLRLRTRILDGLAQQAWDVTAHVDTISRHLGGEHLLQAGKVVRR